MNEEQKTKNKVVEKYEPAKIEAKWQDVWEKEHVYQPDLDTAKNSFYNLMMFPYPSAEGLHVGNMYAFTGADVYGRFQRMRGHAVLEPIGLDGFGIHSENYALKINSHPMEQAAKSEQNFYRQLHAIGNGYDWRHTVETWKPEYYKWTQWVFTELFKAGLAYRAGAQVNWCPSCKTVLADEQVIQKETKETQGTKETKITIGVCERCDTPVEKRTLDQWFFRITDYAEPLLKDLETIDWTEKVKIAQRNWIGRSEGATIRFPIAKPVNFVLLHGFTGGPENDFHPWIKQELEKRGYKVQMPLLPNTEHPTEEEQVEFVLKNIEFDENTILMGHSLGSVVALKVLEKLDKKIAGVVLAAAFIEPKFNDHERPFKDTFTWKFDFDTIRKHVGFVKILRANNDSAVPVNQADILSDKLGGQIIDFTAEGDHITGKTEPVVLETLVPSLEVFTTRPDTLYGATFMVISPEHPLASEISNEQLESVKKYIKEAQSKTEAERVEEGKGKTGVFSGLYAINPVNNQQIPIWIADYVLMGYGTGAIMAVPAHDQRDYDFAKKYNLPITRVIEPKLVTREGDGALREGEDIVKRNNVCVLLKNPKDGKYLCISWKDFVMNGLVTGGIDEGEDMIEAAKREIREETGYKNARFVNDPGIVINTFFYQRQKKQNRWARFRYLEFELENEEKAPVEGSEKQAHEVVWVAPEELGDFFSVSEGSYIVDYVNNQEKAYTGEGILGNSGEWDGWETPEAKEKATQWLEENGFGKKGVQYHLRDWLISRQRYWGAPIPMVYCEACAKKGESWFTTEEGKKRFESGIKNQESGERNHNSLFMIHNSEDAAGWYPEENLPVVLPKIDDYRPVGITSTSSGQEAGRAPLANHPEFYETTCPACGGPARRETDVSDTFLDSGWYFLRYPATDLETIPFPMRVSEPQSFKASETEKEKASKRTAWLPVDQYTGGAEHSVLHLLYARFLYKVFSDLGYIESSSGGAEPFPKFFAHGLIIKDGAKMSKSKGNVVVPDAYIRKYGADTLRTYLMFLGPFSEGGDFQDSGIAGINRFLKRVWTLFTTKEISSSDIDDSAKSSMHRAIKGVTEDLSKFRYNTAIAKLMTWYNELSGRESISREEMAVFLKLLAPFAPHMSEELYQKISKQQSASSSQFTSIHSGGWPEFEEAFLVDHNVTIAIQVNGKLRETITVEKAISTQQTAIEQLAKESDKVQKFIEGKEIKKAIFVPGKILNLVV